MFQSAVEFINGTFVAPVTLILSTAGTHNLRVYLEGVSYSNLVTVEMVPPLLFAGGSGTPDDPYLIADVEQLDNVRHRVNAHFKLISDIDLGDRGWEPIGKSWRFPFQGGFNGNGYVIRNLTVDWPGSYAGLFGCCQDAVFRTINLENVNVSGKLYVGGLVGYMEEGSIEDSTVSGGVTGTDYVGGLVGGNNGGISGSCAVVEVEGDINVGGLAGSSSAELVGSFANGKVTGSERVGGLVGWLFSYGRISGSHGEVDVEGNSMVGGLAGGIENGTITACYAGEDGTVSGNSKVGGLAGTFLHGEISDFYARAGVTGTSGVGGLVGTVEGEENPYLPYLRTKIVNCYAAGAVLGDSSTGGLAGMCLENSSITGCYYDSEVSGRSGEDNQWGTPRTTAEMKRQATFAGWDFDTVWGIVEDRTYPYLRWQDQAGFTVAPVQAGDKTAGKAFELNITGATDVSGSYLDGDFNLIITSDREEGEVYNGPVTFTKGNTAVRVTLTALGKHTLTVTIEGVPGSGTLEVTVKSASGGGSGGGRASTRAESPKASLVLLDGSASLSVPARLDGSTGTAAGEVEAALLDEAFAKSEPNEQGIKQVEIDMPEIDGAKAYEITLPAAALSQGGTDRLIKIKTGAASLTVPGNMLQAAGANGSEKASLTIAAAGRSKLPMDLQAQIGDRPVIELGLKTGGKTVSWRNEDTAATVSIPNLAAEEELAAPEHITVWYIDEKGKVVEVPSGRYDQNPGAVTFRTSHFGNYAVVYVDKTFDDLESVTWAKKQIGVLASKGVLKGVSETEYAPQAAITRADYLYFLVRTLGVNARVDETLQISKGTPITTGRSASPKSWASPEARGITGSARMKPSPGRTCWC